MSPELLMPAGSLEKLEYAYAYGADACYIGVPRFSLRARENDIQLEELKKAVQLARQWNKKIYFTANIFSRNLKLKSFSEQVGQWAQLGPDAFIMSDPGLMSMAQDLAPQIPIHLSVQANCMNWQSVKFWQKQGVTRIILSRELRLEEIKEIHERVPDIELEAFVHGSICIAYSGRCLLSHYMSYRDANQGVCDNSCRYGYHVHQARPENTQNGEYFLEDLRDKGQLYQIDEDENGTYIMNAKDLCVIEHLKELKEAGVCSFKIEGRTKSIYYVSLISRIYRQAIDDLMQGKDFNPQLLTELQKVANRGYDKGFMTGAMSHESQQYEHSVSRNYSQKFSGLVLEKSKNPSRIWVEARHRMRVGEEVEIISPRAAKVCKIGSIYNEKGESVSQAGGGGLRFEMELDCQPEKYAVLSLKESSEARL